MQFRTLRISTEFGITPGAQEFIFVTNKNMVRALKNDEVTVKLDVTSSNLSTLAVKPDLRGDRLNLLLLILLYAIQGVPFGFTVMALPIIMQSKKVVSYEDQVGNNNY